MKKIKNKNGKNKKEWNDCPQKFGRRIKERKYKERGWNKWVGEDTN